MPKAPLIKEDSILESQIIETLIAGHKEWRPDLKFPESWSDMEGTVRGLLRMFKVERRPLASTLKYRCDDCEGLGHFIAKKDGIIHITDCTHCSGGKVERHT